MVRGENDEKAERRLKGLLYYYFSKSYSELFGSRLRVINGDVTQDIKVDGKVDTVFNCAAIVKHFSKGTEIENVNVGGAAHCVRFCLLNNARLIHISTYSTVMLSETPQQCCLFHPYNNHYVHFGDVFKDSIFKDSIFKISDFRLTLSVCLAKIMPFSLRASGFLLFYPSTYPTLPVEFHHDEDAEGDGDGGFKGGETRMESGRKLVGNDVVARPEDACARHQGEDAADEKHGDGALSRFRLQQGYRSDQSGGAEEHFDGRQNRITAQNEIKQPSHCATEAGVEIILTGNAKEGGKRHGAQVGSNELDGKAGSLRVVGKSLLEKQRAKDILVKHKGQSHTQGDAKEGQHGIQEARDASDIVLVGHVADAVGESHARNQGNDGTDNHVAQMIAEADTVQCETNRGGYQTSHDVAHDTRQSFGGDEKHEDPKHESGDERSKAVHEASAEDDAERRAAQGRGQDLLPGGFGFHGADLFQPILKLLQRVLALFHLARQLVDGHHFVEARSLDRDELGSGVVFVRGYNAVAEHEEVFVLNAIVAGDAPHGLFHARDLRTVFQEDGTGFIGEV